MEDWVEKSSLALLRSYLTGGSQEVRWNGTPSSKLEVKYGVRQGSIMGPLLFTLLTSKLPLVAPEGTAVTMYADDTSAVLAAKGWQEVAEQAREIAASIADFSCSMGLALNAGKTQLLTLGRAEESSALPILPTKELTLLGVKLGPSLQFAEHNEYLTLEVKRRIGVVNRLRAHLPPGKLLKEIARSLVVGKISPCAWVTREARLKGTKQKPWSDPLQIALNDLARVLIGARRLDQVRVEVLAQRAGLPSLNEIVVLGAAMAAWKAGNGGALSKLLLNHSSSSRAAAQDLRRPENMSFAARKLALCRNNLKDLRKASTRDQARRVAHKMAMRILYSVIQMMSRI